MLFCLGGFRLALASLVGNNLLTGQVDEPFEGLEPTTLDLIIVRLLG